MADGYETIDMVFLSSNYLGDLPNQSEYSADFPAKLGPNIILSCRLTNVLVPQEIGFLNSIDGSSYYMAGGTSHNLEDAYPLGIVTGYDNDYAVVRKALGDELSKTARLNTPLSIGLDHNGIPGQDGIISIVNNGAASVSMPVTRGDVMWWLGFSAGTLVIPVGWSYAPAPPRLLTKVSGLHVGVSFSERVNETQHVSERNGGSRSLAWGLTFVPNRLDSTDTQKLRLPRMVHLVRGRQFSITENIGGLQQLRFALFDGLGYPVRIGAPWSCGLRVDSQPV